MGIEEMIEKQQNRIVRNKHAIKNAFSVHAKSDLELCNEMLEGFIDDLKQLKSSLPTQQDEVVVPEFVAEWIENNDLSVRSIFWQLENSEIVNLDVDQWIEKNESLFVNAIVNGYTVEKEPLFIMPVPCMRNTLHYCLKDNGEISFRQGNAYKFNQDQLDKYFPEIKAMAVPVEEEAE